MTVQIQNHRKMIKIPEVQIFWGKTRYKKRFHCYFLYLTAPTHCRENWRSITGFHVYALGCYVAVCVWR